MRRIYKRRWNQPHRSGVFASVNTDILSDVSDNVEVGSVDQDEMESDEVGEVEDTNEDVQVKPDDESRAEDEVGEDKTITFFSFLTASCQRVLSFSFSSLTHSSQLLGTSIPNL
jgi:hypothetical protein